MPDGVSLRRKLLLLDIVHERDVMMDVMVFATIVICVQQARAAC